MKTDLNFHGAVNGRGAAYCKRIASLRALDWASASAKAKSFNHAKWPATWSLTGPMRAERRLGVLRHDLGCHRC